MIGLKRGTVKLIPYTSKWSKAFEKERKVLLKALGDSILNIQHIGSTAIPGVLSKPIIDIAIVVQSIKSPDRLIKLLEGLGYEYKLDDDIPGRLFFTKGPEEKRTHYIHVIELGGKEWQNLILFRDYLLSHKEAVQQYNDLKNKLAKSYTLDRKSYTSGKDKFIKAIIKKVQHE